MPVLFSETPDGVVEMLASGKLTKQDYEQLVPDIEKLIEKHGKLRLLFLMQDFHGWEVGALWEDVKFDLKHFNDIDRIALVGEKKWQEGMSLFCKPFTTARISYFDQDQVPQARAWLRSGE